MLRNFQQINYVQNPLKIKMEAAEDDEMALSEHIEEFSQRIIFCLIVLILAILFCF